MVGDVLFVDLFCRDELPEDFICPVCKQPASVFKEKFNSLRAVFCDFIKGLD